METLKTYFSTGGDVWVNVLFGFLVIVITAIVQKVVHQVFDVNLLGKLWPFKKSKQTKGSDAAHTLLLENIFFANASLKLHGEVPLLDISPNKPNRTLLYRDLLYWTIEAIYCGYKKLIKEHDLESLSAEEWSKLIKVETQNMMKTCRVKANDFSVPSNTLRSYNKWIKNYIDMFYTETVHPLIYSSVYTNNIARTATVLAVLNVLIVTLIGDIDKIANDPDVNIDNAVYRGTKIEPLED